MAIDGRLTEVIVATAVMVSCVQAQGQMPDMAAIRAQMKAAQAQMKAAQAQMKASPMYTQNGMHSISFLRAPIEDKTPLSQSEIERFIKRLEAHHDDHRELTQKLRAAFDKAAQKLPPDASYDALVREAIALSHAQDALNARARSMGYGDAQEAMIKTMRIIRALLKTELDRRLAKNTPQEREIFEAMAAYRIPEVNPADVQAIKPYVERLKKVWGGKMP